VAIVSNAFFKYGDKVYSGNETLLFSEFDAVTQEEIKEKLKKEILNGEIDLAKIRYIYSSMDLTRPDDTLCGKIVRLFQIFKKSEPQKPYGLFLFISGLANEKACYELSSNSYEELVKNKGFTKSELMDLLDRYVDNEDASFKEVKAYIVSLQKGIRNEKKLKSALLDICGDLIKSRWLKDKELEIANYLSAHEDEIPEQGGMETIVSILSAKFDSSFGIEYSIEHRYVFYILVIKRWGDNRYE
jgi:hypothetical protein